MPIFMDSHMAPGLTAKQIAEAHYKDTLVQGEFQCRCMTYWYDENEGYVFCLIDAPDRDAVISMHSKAHGLVPHEIIQVDQSVVQGFLGRIRDPENRSEGQVLNVFSEKAFRVVVLVHVEDVKLLRRELGMEVCASRMTQLNNTITKALSEHGGRSFDTLDSAWMFCFQSPADAYNFSSAILNSHAEGFQSLKLKACIHGGMPVDQSQDLFGETIAMARALRWVNEGEIIMTSQMQGQRNFLPTVSDGTRVLNLNEQTFLQALLTTLEQHWNDTSFDVPAFCDVMSMSKPQLYRKCVAVTGCSPNNLLRDFRLEKARDMLRLEQHNITETAFNCGFASASYFTKCFQQKFGVQPLAYQKL